MDNITHTLVGTALAQTRLGKAGPLAPFALVLAANAPDLENVVLAFYDKPTNMIHHRSVTHAVLGVAVGTILLTLVIYALNRWWAGRKRAGPFLLLFGGITLALASHPLLDWLNTYGVRLWLPFDRTTYYGDLVFIIDPWLWLTFLGATAIAGRRTTWGTAALLALALLMTTAVILAAPLTPTVTPIIWLAGLTAVFLMRWAGLGRRHPNSTVAGLLLLAAGYVGFCGWAGHRAWQATRPVITAQLPPGETIIAHTRSPQPANPLAWQLIAETEQAVYRVNMTIGGQPGGAVRLEKNLEDPLVQRVADSREGVAWRTFARHPVAAIANEGRRCFVYLLDARYPMFPPADFATFVIETECPPIIFSR